LGGSILYALIIRSILFIIPVDRNHTNYNVP
jgi:hypothetical protein